MVNRTSIELQKRGWGKKGGQKIKKARSKKNSDGKRKWRHLIG